MTNGYDVLRATMWPIALLIVSIIYKPQILNGIPFLRSLMVRGREVTAFGFTVKVDAPEQQKLSGSPSLLESRSQLRDIPGLPRTKAIENFERDLHEALKHITPENTAIDVLVRNLAQARIEALFGLIYAGIFGSQIGGLIMLRPHRRASNSEAYNFFRPYEAAEFEFYKEYGFSGWLNYLVIHKLIQQDKEDLVMTDLGDDFLIWIDAKKLSINKPH